MPDVIAIQGHGVVAQGKELFLDDVGDGGFAGAGQAGEPQDGRFLMFQIGAGLFVDIQVMPVHVVAAGADIGGHASPDGALCQTVDQNKTAEVAAISVSFTDHGVGEGNGDAANFVQMQFTHSNLLQRCNIQPIGDVGNRADN